jgi:hypothetical protein
MLTLVPLIVAAVLFAAAALNVQSRVNLVAAGLFFWALSVILGRTG